MNLKNLFLLVVISLILGALPLSAAESKPGPATEPVAEGESWSEKWGQARETFTKKIYPEYIQGHLEVGTRSTGYTFTEDTQGEPFDGSFLGSLNEVHESQNYAPIKFFIQYKINPYFGIGTAYDQFKAVTGSSPHGEDGGDGTFTLKGMYFYLLGAYPNETRFTPFVEVGFVSYSSDFEEDDWWYEGGKRVIHAESEVGSIFAIGCDIHVYEKWSVDVYFRHVNVDQDVDYVFRSYVHTPGTFTLSHNEYGIGLKYSF